MGEATFAILRPPTARNEPVKDYAPGSDERLRLQARLAAMSQERIEIPMVIGAHPVTSGDIYEAEKGGPGVCPMLAAHRNGGRTSLASFARAWDRYTKAGDGPRPGPRSRWPSICPAPTSASGAQARSNPSADG
jgi:hypothetical protein